MPDGTFPKRVAKLERETASLQRSIRRLEAVGPTPESVKNPGYRWYHLRFWWKRPLEWWKPRTEMVGIAFAILYAVVTYLQWRDAVDNFVIDERAWVGVSQITTVPSIPEVGKTLKVYVFFKNTGKTPAFDVNNTAVVNPRTQGSRPDFDYSRLQGRDKYDYGILFPSSDPAFNAVPIVQRDGQFTPLDQGRAQQIVTGQEIIYVHGQITYRDMFGESHWTDYCFTLDPPGGSFSSCNEHNYTDHNKR